MSYWDQGSDEKVSPTRGLARSLLHEALALLACAQAAHRGSRQRWQPMGRVVYWTRAQIIEVLTDFLACEGRLPVSREWHNAMAMGLPARQTVMRRFGSLEALVQAMQEVDTAGHAGGAGGSPVS